MDNRLNISVCFTKKVGGYELTPVHFESIEKYPLDDYRKMGFKSTLLAPIHEWQPTYYFTYDPPLIWKNSGSVVDIDIQSALCFLLLMFLSAATVYFSTRCLRRWFPSTTGFSTILWDFFASFFYEPFPSDSGVLAIRVVLSFWLLGITIFCNEVNGFFKGKLSVKEYAGVETEENLDELEYKLQIDVDERKIYYSDKFGKIRTMVLTSFLDASFDTYAYVSKKSPAEKLLTQLVWLGNNDSSPFKYDARIHETIMNWELRLYEGSIGNNFEQMEVEYRLKNKFNNYVQLFTAYEMADLSVPFQFYGYGLAVAIAVKFLETIQEIYKNRKPKLKSKYLKPFP